MDLNQILALVSRWFHILPVIVLVGGTIFMRLSLVPASTEYPASAELSEAIRKRWAKLVMVSILFLLITGLYNSVTKIMALELPPAYHMLVAVKLGLGLVVFFLASLLSGRSAKAQKFREQETKWLNILCLLMLALVLAAGYMKSLATDAPRKEKDNKATTALIQTDDLYDPVFQLEEKPSNLPVQHFLDRKIKT